MGGSLKHKHMLKTRVFRSKSEEKIQEDIDTFFKDNKITDKNIVSVTHSINEYLISVLLIVNINK